MADQPPSALILIEQARTHPTTGLIAVPASLVHGLADALTTLTARVQQAEQERDDFEAVIASNALTFTEGIANGMAQGRAELLAQVQADFAELERLYSTDKVAAQHARQIERIFDKWLHEDALTAPQSETLK